MMADSKDRHLRVKTFGSDALNPERYYAVK